MTLEALKIARIRVQNEIAFIMSDRARGGPAREGELHKWRKELAEFDRKIEEASK